MKYSASILSVLFLLGIFQSAYAQEISKKDQKIIVNIHNIYRSPLRVKKLEWSDDLAKSAQVWASMLEENQCPLVHSPAEIRNNYGENLYAGWSSYSDYHISIKSWVYAWGKEKSYYQYSKNSCTANQMCGHYTQMVWKDTEHIGCALAKCQNPGETAEILVCHYDPPGNYTDELPY